VPLSKPGHQEVEQRETRIRSRVLGNYLQPEEMEYLHVGNRWILLPSAAAQA